MRQWPALLLLAVTGCSTAPIAGFLDLVHPSHVGAPQTNDDPLRNAFPPPPPPGASLQPPSPPIAPPPGPVDSGFAPRDNPPPEPRSRDIPPLTIPNT